MRMNLLSESQGKDRHDANFHTSKFQLNCLRIDLEEQPPSEPLTQGFKNKSTILPHKFTSIAEGSAILSMCALVLAHSRKSAKKSSRTSGFVSSNPTSDEASLCRTAPLEISKAHHALRDKHSVWPQEPKHGHSLGGSIRGKASRKSLEAKNRRQTCCGMKIQTTFEPSTAACFQGISGWLEHLSKLHSAEVVHRFCTDSLQ